MVKLMNWQSLTKEPSIHVHPLPRCSNLNSKIKIDAKKYIICFVLDYYWFRVGEGTLQIHHFIAQNTPAKPGILHSLATAKL
jgi:hypothetical protein